MLAGVSVVELQLLVDDRFDRETGIPVEALVTAMRARRAVATAPPDPDAFLEAYQKAADSGVSAVVSLHISARQSRTCEVAREVAAKVEIPVHVVDSATTGMSLGYAALAAARAALLSASVEQVIEAAHRRLAGSTELIYVDTLEYLYRGGRIGAAAALVGTALSVKPLLTIANGQVAPVQRVLGADRAIGMLIAMAARRAGHRRVDIAVEHFGAAARAAEMAKTLGSRVHNLRELMVTPASAVIGAHLGPGALGITVSPV